MNTSDLSSVLLWECVSVFKSKKKRKKGKKEKRKKGKKEKRKKGKKDEDCLMLVCVHECTAAPKG